MPQANTKLTDEQFWKRFSVELRNSNERRPTGNGWRTLMEWNKITRMCKAATNRFLLSAIKVGKMEKFTGNTNVNGRLTKCVWYRQKP